MKDTPQVWIACLASYNAGRLIGEWVDAVDVDEMYEAQKRVAKAAVKAAKEAGDYPVYFGEPEEFAIHDYSNFGQLASTLGEYPSYETVAKIGALIEEHGDAFIGYIDKCEVDLDEVDEDDFYQHYRGVHDSEEDYARELCQEIGLPGVDLSPIVPSHNRYGTVELDKFDNWIVEAEGYIDWEMAARAVFDHGNYSSYPASSGGVHVYELEV